MAELLSTQGRDLAHEMLCLSTQHWATIKQPNVQYMCPKKWAGIRDSSSTYKARNGSTQRTRKWYVELRDHLSITRRFSAFSDKTQSKALGWQIERLVSCRIAGERPTPELSRWLEAIPNRLKDRFVKIGLLEAERAAAGKPLKNHLKDFEQSTPLQNYDPWTKLKIMNLIAQNPWKIYKKYDHKTAETVPVRMIFFKNLN